MTDHARHPSHLRKRPAHSGHRVLHTARKTPLMAGDDRAGRLLAARDKLAAAIADCDSPRELPGLIREYRLVLADIAGLGIGEETEDVVDQLAKRRNAKDTKRA